METLFEAQECPHGGLTLRRIRDGASIYFQPGDDSAAVRELLDTIDALDIPAGRKASLFNAQAADYFAEFVDA